MANTSQSAVKSGRLRAKSAHTLRQYGRRDFLQPQHALVVSEALPVWAFAAIATSAGVDKPDSGGCAC